MRILERYYSSLGEGCVSLLSSVSNLQNHIIDIKCIEKFRYLEMDLSSTDDSDFFFKVRCDEILFSISAFSASMPDIELASCTYSSDDGIYTERNLEKFIEILTGIITQLSVILINKKHLFYLTSLYIGDAGGFQLGGGSAIINKKWSYLFEKSPLYSYPVSIEMSELNR
ncbi:MAG: hypothetical protein MRY59_08955 [Aquisalinus sp.]|nr:hypothetical protein [Aquisalinus sp.]